MRLIDADSIVVPSDFRVEHFHDLIEEKVAYDLGRAVRKLIDAQPTVEPIIRCKDCVYYGEHTNYIKGKFCIKHSHLNDDFVFHCDEDDYCSKGKRKTT